LTNGSERDRWTDRDGRTATIRNAATQGRLHNKVDYLLEEMITRNPTCEVRTL